MRYLIDICNAFSKIELGITDAVASLDFDEGSVWRSVVFATGI
jgi:hypothetical protein